MARKREFALRRISVYRPGEVVGGVFICPGENDFDREHVCTNENAIPIEQLLADDPYFSWTNLPNGRRIVQRIPMFATLDPLNPIVSQRKFHNAFSKGEDSKHWHRAEKFDENWYEDIDINENYTYTEQERHIANKAIAMSLKYFAEKHKWLRIKAVNANNYDLLADIGDGTLRRRERNSVTQQHHHHSISLLTLLGRLPYNQYIEFVDYFENMFTT